MWLVLGFFCGKITVDDVNPALPIIGIYQNSLSSTVVLVCLGVVLMLGMLRCWGLGVWGVSGFLALRFGGVLGYFR